jgi:DNA alkylation damage repair protein AlkB
VLITQVADGAIHLRNYLTLERQRTIAEECLELGRADPGFYTPIVRGGHPMSVRMLCLGRHWNALTYSYEDSRTDIDRWPVPPLPRHWAALANDAAGDAGFRFAADLCIVNWYSRTSRMGLHQDKDESPASLAAGHPVVSVSIGETARFLFGGVKRKDTVMPILLGSGDIFVFGGPARLRYHGVSRILPDSAPTGLGFEGRLNFTFRHY